MNELKFKIMPRYINGVDQAPETERKTDTNYIQHECYALDKDGVLYVTGAEDSEGDTLLNDPTVLAVTDKLQLAEELIQAALEDAGGGV